MWDAMVYSNNKKFLMGKFNSFCVVFPHNLSAPAIYIFLFVYESQVFVTWPAIYIYFYLYTRAKCLSHGLY